MDLWYWDFSGLDDFHCISSPGGYWDLVGAPGASWGLLGPPWGRSGASLGVPRASRGPPSPPLNTRRGFPFLLAVTMIVVIAEFPLFGPHRKTDVVVDPSLPTKVVGDRVRKPILATRKYFRSWNRHFKIWICSQKVIVGTLIYVGPSGKRF